MAGERGDESQGGRGGHQLGPNLLYFLGVLILIVAVQAWWGQRQATAHVTYDQFISWLEAGRIDTVRVGSDQIVGTLKKPTEQGRTRFTTTRVDPRVYERLKQYDVTVDGRIESEFLGRLLAWLIPIFIFVAIWWFLFRRVIDRNMGGGLFQQMGRSKAKLYREARTGVTFDDVAGVDEAKQELREVVDFLTRPQAYRRLGARIPKGVLLVGPPGTGKTLMAKAVAGEADVAFFSISGSEFVEMFVGVGAKRVRDLFEQARQEAPCIVFIDELDALGRSRGEGAGMGGGNDEKEQTLNQLLAELDGFDPSENIVVLAATNRPEVLDPALQRAGRFDRQVMVDRPDKAGRKQILDVYLPRVRLAEDVDGDKLAGLTAGFTGADLANLVNEAALFATRRKGAAVTMADFENAIERIVAGQEKRTRRLNEQERRVVAYHEMGHALIGLSVSGVDPVQKVSIIPRSVGALGYTIQRPTEDRFLMTRDELENRMRVLLGGRAAESIVFGHLSTGAADDLAKVTDIARSMVAKYGMAGELGHVVYERENQQVMPVPGAKQKDYAEATAREIDAAVKALVDEAFEAAVALLRQRREALEEGAQALLDHETLSGPWLAELMQRHGFAVAAGAEPAAAGEGSEAEGGARRGRPHGSVPPAGKVHEAQRHADRT